MRAPENQPPAHRIKKTRLDESCSIYSVEVCRPQRPTVEHGLQTGSELGYSICAVQCWHAVRCRPQHASWSGAGAQWGRKGAGRPRGAKAVVMQSRKLAACWQRESGGERRDRCRCLQKNTACMQGPSKKRANSAARTHGPCDYIGPSACMERVGARQFRYAPVNSAGRVRSGTWPCKAATGDAAQDGAGRPAVSKPLKTVAAVAW